MRERKYKQGGIQTQFGGLLKAVWPTQFQALFDFWWLRVPQLTSAHDGVQILAFGLISWARGKQASEST